MPMPIRFERWMRSKLSVITARTPSSFGPFAAQSRDDPVPYSLPATMTVSTPSALYFAAASKIGIGSPLRRAFGKVQRVAAFLAAHPLVADADVREGAALHQFEIAAPRAVGVEILGA